MLPGVRQADQTTPTYYSFHLISFGHVILVCYDEGEGDHRNQDPRVPYLHSTETATTITGNAFGKSGYGLRRNENEGRHTIKCSPPVEGLPCHGQLLGYHSGPHLLLHLKLSPQLHTQAQFKQENSPPSKT